MPSKRVSLKGKGADLFFGDYAPDMQLSTVEDIEEERDSSLDRPVVEPTSTSVLLATSPAFPIAETLAADDDIAPPKRRSGSTKLINTPLAASKQASSRASSPSEIVDSIRKVVKVPGKEVSFTRLSPEEKAQITDIVYAYKRHGQKTTENEINRIALNYLLNDYHERGSESVLALVLAALLA